MIRASLISAITVSISVSANADVMCGQTVQGMPALIDDVSKPRPDRNSENDKFISVVDRATSVMWIATKAANPAHPGVACRRVLEKNGELFVDMQAICGGPKPACDSMMKEFEMLNAQMRDEMERARKK